MTERPNLLLLTTDQQAHDLLSCAGNPWLRTPALDRIAALGTRLTRGYCGNPVCLPSRFCWWTGRMPSAIGVRHNGDPIGRVPEEVHRGGLGHLLRAAGYATFFGGKVHLPGDLDPLGLGFDRYYQADERDRLAIDTAALIREAPARPWCIAANFINPHDICYLTIRACAGDPADRRLVADGRSELREVDEALRRLDDLDAAGYAAQVPPLPANHAIPADEPAAIRWLVDERPFRRQARDTWDERAWRRHRWVYHRLVERVDRQIGVVLDALERSGQLEDTVILFTSDHGDHAGSHRLEHKTTFYDEAVRVPLLLAHAGHGPAGVTDPARIANVGLDLMATCCDYAGIERPAHNRGVSLRPVVEGRPDASAPAGSYAESQLGTMWVGERYKYCRYDRCGVEETLHDLVEDPGEMRNLAGNAGMETVLAGCRRALDAVRTEHRALGLVDTARA